MDHRLGKVSHVAAGVPPRRIFITFLFFILLPFPVFSQHQPSIKEILEKAIEKAKKSDDAAERFGFYQDVISKELSDEGNVQDKKEKTYRTIWLEDKPYQELILVNGQPLKSDDKKDEAKRQKEFVESLHKKEKKEDDSDLDFTWDELSRKYDFALLPADNLAPFVLSFQPKSGKLQERNRQERVLNHINGKVWIDHDYNLLRVEAHLIEPVGYGLSILAKIEKLDLDYTQRQFEDVFLPASFHVTFRGRILVKSGSREISSTFHSFYARGSQPRSGMD